MYDVQQAKKRLGVFYLDPLPTISNILHMPKYVVYSKYYFYYRGERKKANRFFGLLGYMRW